MHELPITENIRDIAIRHAQAAGAEKITDIYLVIGELSSVIDESVQFYWGIVCKDTIAESARLHFRRVPAELKCLDCNINYALSSGLQTCPQCDGIRIKVVAGDEFYLASIDIETQPQDGGRTMGGTG